MTRNTDRSRREDRWNGPSRLAAALCAAVALSLAGCGKSDEGPAVESEESEPGAVSLRVEGIDLPRAESVALPGDEAYPPEGSLYFFVNVGANGATRVPENAMYPETRDVDRALGWARFAVASVILRCDRQAKWKHVRPLLAKIAESEMERVWFAVDGPGAKEGFMDLQFPGAPRGQRGDSEEPDEMPEPPPEDEEPEIDLDDPIEDILPLPEPPPEDVPPLDDVDRPEPEIDLDIPIEDIPTAPDPGAADEGLLMWEIWVFIKVEEGQADPQPRILVDQRPMDDWEHVRKTLEQLGRTPRERQEPVVIAPDDDAEHGWIIRVLDLLKQLKYANIAFRGAGLESIDVPSNTPVFAVPGHTRGPTRRIYSGRSSSGRAKALGGPGGTTEQAESAVLAGLKWLAKAQEPDGRWSCRKWDGAGDHDVGMTGLALLAFLGRGYTHTQGRFRTTVDRGLTWLKANQKQNGSFGWGTFYEQGIATMAVSEAYGLTRSDNVKRMSQRAVDYIIQEQPDHGGFRYRGGTTRDDGDVSVTGWQILAIKSAICSELNVPEQAVERSRTFLRNVTRDYGRNSYLAGGGHVDPSTSAIGMLCKQLLGGDFDDDITACADYLLKDGAKVGEGKNALVGDLYYTHYASHAMFLMGGEHWIQWNKLFRDPLVKAQIRRINDSRGRYVRGSWEPASHHWGKMGGRVYSTAMALLSLEVYYRSLPLYKR